MCESDAYKNYKKHIRSNTWKEFKKYINKRNLIAILIVTVVIALLYFGAVILDNDLAQPVWVDRFWNIGFSGVLGSLVVALWNFIKDKK